MRLIVLTIIFGFWISNSFADVESKILSAESAKEIAKEFNISYSNERLIVVLFNPNDCGYCLNALSLLKEPIKYAKTVFLSSSFLNPDQISSFRKNYSIDSSITIQYDKHKVQLFKDDILRSTNSSSVYILNGNVLSSGLLKEYGLNLMLKSKVSSDKNITISQSDYFFSSIGTFAKTSDMLYAVTYPKADVSAFNLNGDYINSLKLDSSQLRRIYDRNLKNLTLEQQGYNNFDSSMSTFNKVMKPMGFSTIQTEGMTCVNDEIWAVIIGKCPIFELEDRVVFQGQRILANLVVIEGSIKIKKMLFFEETDSVKLNFPDKWFVYSANYLKIRDDLSVVIGCGSANNSDMRKGDDFLLRKYEFRDSKIIATESLNAFKIPEKIYKFNDSLANLAFVASEIIGGNIKEFSFKHLPFLFLESQDSFINPEFDLSNNKYIYYNLYNSINEKRDELISLVNFKGWTYLLKFGLEGSSSYLKVIIPLSFGEALTPQRVTQGSNNKEIDVLLESESNKFTVITIDLEELVNDN